LTFRTLRINPHIAAFLIIVGAQCSPLIAQQAALQPSSPACSDSAEGLAHATALSSQMEEDDKAREKWNRVPEVLTALGIKAGSSVADVGSGIGFFTLRLACAVGPSGRVFAIDIDKKVLKTLKARLRKGAFHNVIVIHSKPDDPMLQPDSIDAALFVGSYHEMKSHDTILEHVRNALHAGGRVVVMEKLTYWESLPPGNEARQKQEERHNLDSKFVKHDLQEGHFQVTDCQPTFFRSISEYSLTVAQTTK